MQNIGKYFERGCKACFLIAEVAQTHDGSLGQAYAFVDVVAEAGVDAIKFQTHIADAESTLDEPFRVKFSRQDRNRYDYWKRMEFTPEQWCGLAKYARSKGLHFLSSPFSLEAVNLLQKAGIAAWKIGSGELGNEAMLERIVATRKPVLISTGMSTDREIKKVVAFLKREKTVFSLFQATTMYPTPPEKIGLNVLAGYSRQFGCPVGLSDHSGTIYPGLAACALGARFVEVHVTMSRHMFGPDVIASVTMEELAQLAKGVRFLEIAALNPVKKNSVAKELETIREIFRRSVVPRTDLPAGKILEEGDLILKKPNIGIPASMLKKLYGKKLKRCVCADEFISLKDLK
ncbi:MAG: N-acetylneuraminate synthase family protein [Deltaproteobacteria bacterium]|nr:N-acetylneuraminate synthase family protein [Deltaproteobacteria bacterium]